MSVNRVVVLLPGLGFARSTMRPLQYYCETVFPSTIIDYETDSFDTWLTRCEKELPSQVHLVGWSLGGLLAWKLAQLFPKRVLSVATFSSSPRFLAAEDWPGVSTSDWAPFLDFSQQTKMQQHLLRLQGDRQTVREMKSHLIATQSWQWGLEMLANCDEREWLQQASLPKCLVLAENDAMLPVVELATATNAVILPDTGHACVYSHPEACFKVVQEFWYEC